MKINAIYLSWRKGLGSRRKLVGYLKRTANEGITFSYIKDGVNEAVKEGFKEYPGFPLVFDKTYDESNLDIFGIRLIPFDRKDSSRALSFWEAEKTDDKFTILALTQALLPTDNFEFLGLYNPTDKMVFVTDLAHTTAENIDPSILSIGDLLYYEKERNKYAFRDIAIKVYKGDTFLGYIKNVHNLPFLNTRTKLKLTVKAIDSNGYIRRIFVKVTT